MSHLKSLKLAAATPVRVNADPAQRIREKVIAALEEQKAMAEAKIAGRNYAPTHMVWQKDDAGQRVRVEKPRHVRQGWFEDAEAKTFFIRRESTWMQSIGVLWSPPQTCLFFRAAPDSRRGS